MSRPTPSSLLPVLNEFDDLAMAVSSIRWALVIGLQSLCELDRVTSACTAKTPDDQRPIHPTGSDDTYAEFADALRWVESLAKGHLTSADGAVKPQPAQARPTQ